MADHYRSPEPAAVIGCGLSRLVGFSQDYETDRTHAFRTKCPHHFMNESTLSLVKNARDLPPLAKGFQTADWLQFCQSVASFCPRPHISHWSVLGVQSASCCSEPATNDAKRQLGARTHPRCTAKLGHTRLCGSTRVHSLQNPNTTRNYKPQPHFNLVTLARLNS